MCQFFLSKPNNNLYVLQIENLWYPLIIKKYVFGITLNKQDIGINVDKSQNYNFEKIQIYVCII